MKERTEFKGLWFSVDTPQLVKNAISHAFENRLRIRLHQGDIKTGRLWLGEFEVIGTIGRSTGTQKLPLLIHNVTSHGGGAILDDCILGIQLTDGKQWLYKAANWQAPALTIETPANAPEGLPFSVVRDGKDVQANFEARYKAQRYIDFMNGLRMRVR